MIMLHAVYLMADLQTAIQAPKPPPAATKGVLELLLVFVGVSKWPALIVAAGAAVVAFNNQPTPGEQSTEWLFGASVAIGTGALTWFVLGLLFGD